MSASIVSAAWLYEHLDDPSVAIVDCRFNLMQPDAGQQQYRTAHIPGADYLDLNQDLSSPKAQHGGRHPLPTVNVLEEKLRQIGVNSHPHPTLVIAYDDSRLAFASRLWWLLGYLGHTQMAVLDGGWSAWMEAQYPTTRDISPVRSGNFKANVQPDRVVDIAQVKAKQGLPTVALIDSREGERYRGEREPIDPIAGHIPGALNYPWTDVTDAQGRVRSIKAQQERWQTLPTTDEVIVYCGSGVTACVNLLSLELAGIPAGKLYAGSWSDWCSYLKTTQY
jgi:thiosulfate/3-mercaptopyruvate sulfurtransferase